MIALIALLLNQVAATDHRDLELEALKGRPAAIAVSLLGVQGPGADFVALDRFLKARAASMLTCFANRPDAKARLAFSVGRDGRPADVRLDPAPPEVTACLQELVRGWTLPFKPTGPASAEAAVAFTAAVAPYLPFISDADRAPIIRGRVSVSTPVMAKTPDVDAEAFERFVRSRKTAIQGCYEKELKKDPALKGTLKITLVMTKMGRTSDVQSSEGLTESVQQCVKAVVRGWVFPFKPADDVPIALPMAFAPAQ